MLALCVAYAICDYGVNQSLPCMNEDSFSVFINVILI